MSRSRLASFFLEADLQNENRKKITPTHTPFDSSRSPPKKEEEEKKKEMDSKMPHPPPTCLLTHATWCAIDLATMVCPAVYVLLLSESVAWAAVASWVAVFGLLRMQYHVHDALHGQLGGTWLRVARWVSPAFLINAHNWTHINSRNTTGWPLRFLVTWWMGGNDYQIEHHVYPHVSRFALPTVSMGLRIYARARGVPYTELTVAEQLRDALGRLFAK